MKDTKRNDLLRRMGEDLSILLAGTEQANVLRALEPKGIPLATKAVERLFEYAAGWPTGGDGGVSGTRDPDKIGNQVAALVDPPEKGKSKPATFPLPAVLEEHIRLAAHHLEAAAKIAAEAVIPINAASLKAKDNADDWCASCARVTDHRGRPRAEPSQVCNGSVRRTPEGTVNGRTQAPLCGWCYGFVLGEQAWPPVPLLERRRDGFRISTEDVDRAMGRKTTAA